MSYSLTAQRGLSRGLFRGVVRDTRSLEHSSYVIPTVTVIVIISLTVANITIIVTKVTITLPAIIPTGGD